VIMVCTGAAVAACQSRCGRAQTSNNDDEYGVRLLRRNGETQSSQADYDAELDSDSDTVAFLRPNATTDTVRRVDEVTQ